jgi:hypothetical protein
MDLTEPFGVWALSPGVNGNVAETGEGAASSLAAGIGKASINWRFGDRGGVIVSYPVPAPTKVD